MKPCAVRIWTDRLEESRDFYTKVLPFVVKVDGTADGWIILGTDSIDLILERDGGDWSARYTALSLWVDDIHETVRQLRNRGVNIVSGPTRQDWGGWLCDFQDNTGNTLTLVQNPEP